MLRSIRNGRRVPAQNTPTSSTPKPGPLKFSKSVGIVYVAYGERAKQATQASLKSAKAIHPGIVVAVISDTPVMGADIQLTQPEKDKGAREYKTQVYQYSPFEYTLYLDADTLVVGSLRAGFSALEAGWDMAAALDFRQTIGRIDHIPANDVQATIAVTGTGEYPHLNTGMLFFRKSPECEALFDLWYQEWLKFKYRDQGAFVRAVYRSEARIWVLAWQWNTHRKEKAKHVLHLHHSVDRTWTGGMNV